MEKIVIREKTTSSITMQLKTNSSAINLTGVDHIRLDMVDSAGGTYRYSSSDASPALVITTAASGIVTFTPPSESVFQYLKNPYKIYIYIFETSTKKYAVPESEYAEIYLTKES